MLFVKVEPVSGVVGRIYKCLASAAYGISSNKLIRPKGRTDSYVKFTFNKGELPLPFEVESELLNIKGCLEFEYEDPGSAEESTRESVALDSKSVELLRSYASKTAGNFALINDYIALVRDQHGAENQPLAIFKFGKELGRLVYLDEYSLGKPLEAKAFLKRSLAVALKKFGRVSIKPNGISIKNNVFCTGLDETRNCVFTHGFICGFIRACPTVSHLKVSSCACGSSCSFLVNET